MVIERQWQNLNLTRNTESGINEALSAILRIIRGNFRLLNRLMMQIERIMEINQLEKIDSEVVEAARECLVIGM